ncbi:MAG: N-acetylmuramoyl-L-alanine amidase [Pseudomonadota bacterium]
MNITIKRHKIHVNGAAVDYRQTPNGSGVIKPIAQIMHHTASGVTPGGDISWFTSPRAKASAHTLIARDGTITQFQALNRRTWHAGRSKYQGRSGCNAFTIGHEIDNPGQLRKLADGRFKGVGGTYEPEDIVEMSSPNHGNLRYWLEFTDRQLETVFELALAIDKHYGLGGKVATHWEISPGRKVDTGPHFPLESLRGLLDGRGDYKPTIDKDTGEEIDGIVIARGGLNLRAWPTLKDNVIKTLPHRTGVDLVRSITNENGEWLLVNVGDETGWVSRPYVDLV